jgi:hypothetical protein|tara:strand:- start:489 stop:863 length:375 start_codon:yes stop_codon:yes gene_type:complete
MTYIAIVNTTPDNKIAKLQEYETKKEADDHILRVKDSFPNAFVVERPEPYVFEYMTVNVGAKTITFDKARWDSDQAVVTSTQYQRERLKEYPSIAELVVALYDTQDRAEIDQRRADVKKKYPKN